MSSLRGRGKEVKREERITGGGRRGGGQSIIFKCLSDDVGRAMFPTQVSCPSEAGPGEALCSSFMS